MSQPYYSDYSQQQYYPSDSYDSANNMHTPIQSHASAYGYQNEYYDAGVTSNAQPVNNSSTLAQTYSYSNENYTADTTADTYSSHNSVPNHTMMHNPDSVGQIPHQGMPQYGDAAPGHGWTGPAQYTEDTTVQPGDLHDQRRGSCASMATADSWYSHDSTNGEHHGYTQPAADEQNYYANHYYQQPEPRESGNFGMYSPTQHSRMQELARSAPYDTQWMPVAPVPQGNLDAPYGTLPIHESNTQYECQPSDSHQQFDNGPIGYSHPAQTSPMIQQHPSPAESHQQPSSSPANSSKGRSKDLYIQQRQAASYQNGLRVQQERKYQLSGHLEQFEATRRRQESFTIDQNYTYTLAHDTPHHQNHPAHHQRQGSSSSDHRLPSAPVVPSQAHERDVPCLHSSPEVEEKKKETTSKKPALACLFCRKRKIACGPPSPDNPDRTCNQCARRKQTCEYPTESRRGIRKTQKEPVHEEPPTLHQFVHGDDTQHEFSGPIRNRRRKYNI